MQRRLYIEEFPRKSCLRFTGFGCLNSKFIMKKIYRRGNPYERNFNFLKMVISFSTGREKPELIVAPYSRKVENKPFSKLIKNFKSPNKEKKITQIENHFEMLIETIFSYSQELLSSFSIKSSINSILKFIKREKGKKDSQILQKIKNKLEIFCKIKRKIYNDSFLLPLEIIFSLFKISNFKGNIIKNSAFKTGCLKKDFQNIIQIFGLLSSKFSYWSNEIVDLSFSSPNVRNFYIFVNCLT